MRQTSLPSPGLGLGLKDKGSKSLDKDCLERLLGSQLESEDNEHSEIPPESRCEQGVVAHTCDPDTGGSLQVQGQPRIRKEILFK